MRSPHVPTRVSVPFERGELADPMGVVMRDSRDRAVPVQGRSLLDWDDGSCKWGLFVFEPGDDGGPFALAQGENELADKPLVVEDGDLVVRRVLNVKLDHVRAQGRGQPEAGQGVVRCVGSSAPVADAPKAVFGGRDVVG